MQQTSPHKPIIAKENTAVKYLRSLFDSKTRKKERAFLIEGTKIVEDALRDDLNVAMVVATPDLVRHHGKGILKQAESKSVKILWISRQLMDAISESKTPQPVMAVARMKQFSGDDLLDNNAGLIIIAHQLQDPGNLGSIIRTAEAVGASGVAITSNTVDPFNAKTIRASMGSILRLPLVHIGDGTAFIKASRQKKFQTVATMVTGKQTHFDVDLTKPTVVILGQEGTGLPQDISADVDLFVRIPMSKSIDSLNVSVAAAVVLYETMRQRFYINQDEIPTFLAKRA
jgi:TrmH family RNA methyltransferase